MLSNWISPLGTEKSGTERSELTLANWPDMAVTGNRLRRIAILGITSRCESAGESPHGSGAKMLDYTVDAKNGALVNGSNAEPVEFKEYWTFTRPVGPNPWKLSAVQQA